MAASMLRGSILADVDLARVEPAEVERREVDPHLLVAKVEGAGVDVDELGLQVAGGLNGDVTGTDEREHGARDVGQVGE